jgi:hypothetical protein
MGQGDARLDRRIDANHDVSDLPSGLDVCSRLATRRTVNQAGATTIVTLRSSLLRMSGARLFILGTSAGT